MSVDIATLGLRVDSRQVKQADADLEKLAKTGKKTENATKDLTRGFGAMGGALAALGITGVVVAATRMADAWKNVQGRLSLVTASTGELAGVTQALFEVSNRTRNSFEATADLYANLARTTKVLGASQGQLLQVTESISQALIVSGATASGSEAALRQLGQAFASGALRGDELNSIMENTPRIASAIADGMGITIGQLRTLGKEGALTADAIFMALLSQKEVLETEFGKMPVTVAQSFTVLRNEIMKYVGDSDNLTGATSAIAGAITGLSKAIGVIIPSVLALATALGVGFVSNAIAAKLAATAATTSLAGMAVAARAAGASLLAAFGGPIGLAITGVGLALAYLYGQSITSASAIDGVEASAKEVNARLEVSIARALEAGVSVDTLGNAASSSTPLINTVANAYKNAGDKAAYLAQKAKEAAIAVAQGNIANLRREQAKSLGPLNTLDRAERAAKGPWSAGKVFSSLTGGFAVANQLGQELLGGPTARERRQTASQYGNQIKQEQENLRLIGTTPASAFGDKPLNSIPATQKPEKAGPKKREPGKTDAERELEQQTRASKEFALALKEETADIGKNSVELKLATAYRAAAKAPTKELRDAILDEAQAWEKATIAEANKNFKQDMGDQVEQMKFENSLIGMNSVEREKANLHRAIELKIRDASRSGIQLDIENIQAETKALLDNIDAKARGNKALEKAQEVARGMQDAADAVRDMTEGFGELFGTAGEGFSNLINTIFEYGDAQARIAEQQAEINTRRREDGSLALADEHEYNRLADEGARNRIANYGNMIGAAKTFFKEGSTGWKIMEGAERAYRLFQFAMQVKAIVMDTVQTGTSVANSATRASASGVEAVAKAMASLPPPLNFIAAGAVIAFLVAMGVKMMGGGGKGGASASSGFGSASKAAKSVSDPYNGPRDEYGAPTSYYSVLKPGATTVANDNPAAAANTGTFRGGDLIINGGADRRTTEELQTQFQVWSQRTVEEARIATAQDRAEQAGRQQIGGRS